MWIEGIHWIRDTFRGKQQTLADNDDYRRYAARLGYGHLDLSEIPAIRLFCEGLNTLADWMQRHPEHIPESWEQYGFRDSNEFCCYASIHFQKIREWAQPPNANQ